MTAVRQYTFGCRERQIKIDRDEMGFVGPFAHFFRTHAKDLDGATAASTFGGGLLANTLDELLQHLADTEKSIEGFYSIDVEASSEVLKVLEDTNNPPRGFYNAVVTTYAKTPAAMVHISVLEQYDELADAMEAGSDREGGSGSVWVIDLNTLDVTFRSVAAVTDRAGTVERAVELLKPYGAAMWHSGGGIMLARIDLPDACPFAARCPIAVDACRTREPDLVQVETGSGEPHQPVIREFSDCVGAVQRAASSVASGLLAIRLERSAISRRFAAFTHASNVARSNLFGSEILQARMRASWIPLFQSPEARSARFLRRRAIFSMSPYFTPKASPSRPWRR